MLKANLMKEAHFQFICRWIKRYKIKRIIIVMRKKILIVDDEPGCREALKIILKNKYNIVVTDNGIDAIELIKQGGFHLIILDIIMPKINGIEVLKRIREFDTQLKVIILTAIKNKEFVEEAEKLGVSGYIFKPFDVTKVTTIVDKVLI